MQLNTVALAAAWLFAAASAQAALTFFGNSSPGPLPNTTRANIFVNEDSRPTLQLGAIDMTVRPELPLGVTVGTVPPLLFRVPEGGPADIYGPQSVASRRLPLAFGPNDALTFASLPGYAVADPILDPDLGADAYRAGLPVFNVASAYQTAPRDFGPGMGANNALLLASAVVPNYRGRVLFSGLIDDDLTAPNGFISFFVEVQIFPEPTAGAAVMAAALVVVRRRRAACGVE